MRVSSTGRSLRLDWFYIHGDAFEGVEPVERDDRVEIGIVVRVDSVVRFDDARPARTRVLLSQPLGDGRTSAMPPTNAVTGQV